MAKKETPPGGAKAAEPPATPAAETPPVETPAEETPPAPTPDEIQAQVDAIFAPVSSAVNARIQEERAKEADKPVVEGEPQAEDLPQSDAPGGGEKVERSDTPAAEEKPADEPKPEEPPTGERFVPGAMTPEQVEATARQAAREEIESREPALEPAPEVPHGTTPTGMDGLSDAAQDQLMVLNKMATLNPAHRDLPERQKKFWKLDEQYRARWEQSNPGQPFDPNAPDHAEFYRKNEPFVPLKDYKAAERAIIADEAEERAVARVRKEQEPRLREMEFKERERDAAPSIQMSMADAAEEVFAAVPQFKDTFKPKEMDRKSVEKMEEINPALAHIAREEAEEAAVLVGELEKLDRLQGHYQVNKERQHKLSNGKMIAPHAVLEAEFAECEASFLSKPVAEQVRDGKKLIRFDQAMQRAQRIHQDSKMRPDQKQRAMEDLTKNHWWVQSADVAKHIRAKKAARVSHFAEQFSKIAPAAPKNTAANGQQVNGTPATNGKPAATSAKPSGKAGLPRGTSTASSSDISDNAPRGQSEAQKAQEFLVKAAFP